MSPEGRKLCLSTSTTIPFTDRDGDPYSSDMVVVPASQAPRSVVREIAPQIETLVIDRQPLFLAALASLLGGDPLSAHVLTASRSDVGLEIARAETLHLVFCELRADPVSGVEVVRVLTEERPDLPIILLGDETDRSELVAAISTSVAGVFTKSAAPEEFLVGVRAVLSGHRAIGSLLMDQLLERLAPPFPHETRRFANQLSPTELDILAMIGRAHSIPNIAATRGISHKTVRNHLSKIYRKLDLHGRTEAMLWATRMGLTGS